MPVEIPSGVTASIKDNEIKVKGPKGELSEKIVPNVKIVEEDKKIIVSVEKPENKQQASLWGLYRSLVANMVKGVLDGFEKKLEINGVGYKASVTGKNLVLNVGFSHQVEFSIPEEIEINVDKNIITIFGPSKQQVGEAAAQIRKIRKVEPYKLKGIKYVDEEIKKKAGKVAKGAGDA